MNAHQDIQIDDAGFWDSVVDIYNEMTALRVAAGENGRNQALAHLRIPDDRRHRNRYIRPLWLTRHIALPVVEYRLLWRHLRSIGLLALVGRLWVFCVRMVHTLVVSTLFMFTLGWLFTSLGQLLLTAANLATFSESTTSDLKTYIFSGYPWVAPVRAQLFDHNDDIFYTIPPETRFPTLLMMAQVVVNSIVLDLNMKCTRTDGTTICVPITDSLIFAFDRAISTKVLNGSSWFSWVLSQLPWLIPAVSTALFVVYVVPPIVLLVNMAAYIPRNYLHRYFFHSRVLEAAFKALWSSMDM